MDKERIIARINKCFKLADSAKEIGQPHEAATALKQARKLMDAYQISDADLAFASMGKFTFTKPHKTMHAWEVSLLTVVTAVFGATYTFTTYQGRVEPKINLYGPEYRLPAIEHVYAAAHSMICRATTVYMKERRGFYTPTEKPHVRQAFRDGFVQSLEANLRATFNFAEIKEAADYRSLVLKDVKLRESRGSSSRDKDPRLTQDAFNQGLESGRTASIHIPLG